MKLKQKHSIFLALITLAAVATAVLGWANLDSPSDQKPASNTPETQQKNQQPNAAFNKQQYSIDDPASLWMIVNKKRPLPSTYEPANLVPVDGRQLRSDAAAGVTGLIQSAGKENVPLKVISGYRPYQVQASTYNSFMKRDGQSKADTYSARPGYSEHQTGLAVDLGNKSGACDLEICFGETPGGQWIAAHAYEYGFIIRYQKGHEHLSGYQYEPWHLRYVGIELAAELHRSGETMEQFFGLPAASSY